MSEAATNATLSGHGDVAVSIEKGDWDSLDEPDQICRAAVRAALAEAAHAETERPEDLSVNVLLSDDEHLGELNQRFRSRHGPTNVLAFPSGAAPPIEPPTEPPTEPMSRQSHPVGDIAVAFQTMAAEAAEQGKSVAHHLSHLIVHGTLHLLGYDHQTDAQATAMEEMERRALRRLDIDDPYCVALGPDDE